MTAPALEVAGLRVSYADRRRGAGRNRRVAAVRGVDLTVARGEALGLVGESGSGKSTLARALVGVVEPDAGRIRVGGEDVARLRAAEPRAAARRIQMVFQDVSGALDPRQRVGAALREVLAVHGLGGADEGRGRSLELLEQVGLAPTFADRFPHQLSGGQRQRVGIARAVAVEPEVLVLDEPVSALDVSVQARILGLLDRLREELGLGLLLIAHDLAVVRSVCHRVAVLYGGRIMEEADTDTIYERALHPCTLDLLAAVPVLGERSRPVPSYDPSGSRPSGTTSTGGCPYADRCTHPGRNEACTTSVPSPVLVKPGHRLACVKEADGHGTGG